MKREFTQMKLGVIKTYCKKKEQYNLSKKEEDANLRQDRETLELHLSIVDLVAACARNSPFGIAQAQKLIDVEELLESILSDAIPYLVKKHYFNLLFEIYLRKVPGLQQTNRLQINDIKFVQIMKWVVLFDFQHCYNYYTGVITEQSYQDPPEIIRKVKQVIREVERASEKEYDDLNSGKTEKDKDDERKYKASLSTFNSQSFFVLDTNDQSEFWRYMYEYNKAERTSDGLLCFIERFYRDYDVQDIQDDDMQDITVKIRDRLLAIANQIFLFIEAHEGFIKPDIFDLLREINKTVQRIPHIRAFRAGIKRVVKDGKVVVADKNDEDVDDGDLGDESRDLDNRMCGEKIIRILRDYIMKENLHIKAAFGIDDITTDHYIDRDKLKDQIKAITGAESSFEEIMKALDHFQKVANDKKKEKKAMEVDKPGSAGYIMNRYDGADQNIADLIRQNKMNFRDLEVQLKDVLKKQGYKAPNQQRERGGEAFENLMPNITETDLSIMINIDLKLFTQRFFEFAHMTKNVSEIHDFVNKMMMDEDINATKEAQVQLIENLCSCFTGLQGIDDELVLISLLTIMLQRLMPEKDELVDQQETEIQKTIFRKKNEELKQKLRMTQEIMFDAKVPQLMLSFINTQHDNFLANKALNLLNCMMFKASEQMQRKILAFLRKDDLYFSVFFYVRQRLDMSKTYLLQKIKINAKQKFIDSRMKPKEGQMSLSNDFKNQKIYMSQKFDLEYKYEELQIIWKQEEITILLSFLNAMCEGCFRESQLYLRSQIDDRVENFKDNKQGKITSIDLIYETVTQFIDIVESLGKFVFSDFRTYKLIPFLLDTIIEFIYGPNIENQMFLGRWKKLIQKIDFLMQLDDMGNYSGIHQEAKAQLKILFACSNILLAIIDIKDKEKATEIHQIVLGEIDVDNLMSKMVDIYLFKIGGSKEKKEIYKFNKTCNHYKNRNLKEGDNHCMEDEFCQHGYLIPRDRETIQTGFNIFQILQILRRSLPNHPKLAVLEIDQQKYDFLWKDYDYYFKHIFLEIQRSYMAKPMFDRYMNFDCNSKKLIDQLIIKCFPDIYIKYLEVIAKGSQQEDDAKKQALLLQVINMSKDKKSLDDQSKMLQKVQQKIHEDIEKEVHRKEYEKLIGELDTHGDEEEDHDPLIAGPGGYVSLVEDGPKKSIFSRLKKSEEKDEQKIKQDRKTLMLEFQEKLKVFKYYLACDFYEDNIGHVEILQGDEIIEATFMMPSIVHLLPPISRKKIPRIIFKVSQQEKLEAFMSNVPLLREEMIWQQRLGQFSGSVKMFANRYFELSYVNFTMICLVNILFLQTLGYDEIGVIQFQSSWQRPVVEGISTIQTFIAFVVMFSYYLESRAKFVYLIKQLDSSQNKQSKGFRAIFEKIKSLVIKTGNVVVKPPEEGLNKGSQGFGIKKAEKHVNTMQNLSVITSIVKLSQNNIIVEWSLYLAAEIVTFVRSIFIDYDHALHCLYVFISILSIGNNFFNAVLLIDIIKKIPSLKDIINILEENLHQIIPTLALFLVALYIFAFYAFNNFDDAFESDPDPGADHAAGFQMYCDTLANCLLSTVNVGIRSGGGLGENLSQVDYFDDLYVTRYIFDMAFFLIINIVLLNIFFGIIIDAFADKRAVNTEQDSEMVNQCFICGVSKSRFDIENIPWKEHIYKQHNMHSYLAFVLYVQSKPASECTGVEKYVKQRIQSNNVDFFPVNRCLAIKGGQVLE